jgi:hypothetical protein
MLLCFSIDFEDAKKSDHGEFITAKETLAGWHWRKGILKTRWFYDERAKL